MWGDLNALLLREGPVANPDFEPPRTLEEAAAYRDTPILVVGAGGLGCELLKDLCLSGFRNIHVIDMDVIDISNLNRQFLFRAENVGQYKAEVAAKFVSSRISDVSVVAHCCRIQEKDVEFYRQFKIVISGLDNVDARRWLNQLLVGLVQYDEDGDLIPTTIVPLIDGGTEGLKGQARVILPTINACFECTLDLFPPQKNFPLCTLAATPRTAEHCIEWAHLLAWPQHRGEEPFDSDNNEHIQWVTEKALKRADEFHIKGVTYRLTQGVVKRIIPAVASTNAIIAAQCAAEALKIASGISTYLDDYLLYNGQDGVYTYTYKNEKRADCWVCGRPDATDICISVSPSETLAELRERLADHPQYQCKNSSIRVADRSLYLTGPADAEEQTRPNLDKRISELIGSGDTIHIAADGLPFIMFIRVVWDEETAETR